MKNVARRKIACAFLGLALLVPHHSALAADPVSVEPYPYTNTVSGSFTIYGWAPFINGDAGIKGLRPVKISLDPIDILNVLDFTVMATAEVRSNRFGLFGDLIYLKISKGRATPGPLFSTASISLESTILTAAGTYQLWENDRSWVQAIAGVRYWSFNTTLNLLPGLLPAVSASDSISWIDPLVGIRARHAINDRVFLTGSAAIGGFGAGSKFMWDVTGVVGYRFNESISMSAGYRALGVDYKEGGDVINLVNHGPIFGLSINF